MIYKQSTWIAINKLEDLDDFNWYRFSDGILGGDNYSEKRYAFSTERPKNYTFECNIDKVIDMVKDRKCNSFFRIVKCGLFNRKEYLEFVDGTTSKRWALEDIERINAWANWEKEDCTINEAKDKLDIEEYAKMMKGLGLNDVK